MEQGRKDNYSINCAFRGPELRITNNEPRNWTDTNAEIYDDLEETDEMQTERVISFRRDGTEAMRTGYTRPEQTANLEILPLSEESKSMDARTPVSPRWSRSCRQRSLTWFPIVSGPDNVMRGGPWGVVQVCVLTSVMAKWSASVLVLMLQQRQAPLEWRRGRKRCGVRTYSEVTAESPAKKKTKISWMSQDRKGMSTQGWHRYDTIYKTTWDIKTVLRPKVIAKALMEIGVYGDLTAVERKPTWSSRCRSMPTTIGLVHVYHRGNVHCGWNRWHTDCGRGRGHGMDEVLVNGLAAPQWIVITRCAAFHGHTIFD